MFIVMVLLGQYLIFNKAFNATALLLYHKESAPIMTAIVRLGKMMGYFILQHFSSLLMA